MKKLTLASVLALVLVAFAAGADATTPVVSNNPSSNLTTIPMVTIAISNPSTAKSVTVQINQSTPVVVAVGESRKIGVPASGRHVVKMFEGNKKIGEVVMIDGSAYAPAPTAPAPPDDRAFEPFARVALERAELIRQYNAGQQLP